MADKKESTAKAADVVTVRMLQSMAGVRFALAPGDIYECSIAEAERLIERGFAAAIED